jgi:membrane-bound inhibitor of C-type lysozyme
MNKKVIILIVIVIIVATALVIMRNGAKVQVVEQPVATVTYACNAGRTITAAYFQGANKPATDPNLPPTPGGSVALTLSDGRIMTLAQTISADGVRYANTDESFVFWSKGNGVLVLENNVEKSYIGCIAVAPEPSGGDLSQIYATSTEGFSIRYPNGYTIDESYKYQELGPGKNISGIKFTIPTSVATGTNLGSDSYISVEEIPQINPPVGGCTANLFLDHRTVASAIIDGDTTYSIASSTGAGAGNRYEETVYALPGTNPCIAVRYFIHYGVIENYTAGAVHEFDKQTLLTQFDAIRRTLVIAQ